MTTYIRAWVWWAAEQFAVLFIPKASVLTESGELIPCSTCWWYRGLLFGALVGFIVGWLL